MAQTIRLEIELEDKDFLDLSINALSVLMTPEEFCAAGIGFSHRIFEWLTTAEEEDVLNADMLFEIFQDAENGVSRLEK